MQAYIMEEELMTILDNKENREDSISSRPLEKAD